MNNQAIYYSVGALLYCPADNTSIASSIISQKFGTKFSLALCLEDTINDNFVAKAEDLLISSINDIYQSRQSADFFLPKIFIRVRNPEQIRRLSRRLGDSNELITGYIIPKFSPADADSFLDQIAELNGRPGAVKYAMPIYESPAIVNLSTRYDILYGLKEKLASVEPWILNIRVGGNDLSNLFGFRRESDESIHQISPIANIFSDIITVYGMDYVISGPVWEYYSGPQWEAGLRKEIKDDRLCGFIGKTVIHPGQIPVVNDACRVSEKIIRTPCISLTGTPERIPWYPQARAENGWMNTRHILTGREKPVLWPNAMVRSSKSRLDAEISFRRPIRSLIRSSLYPCPSKSIQYHTSPIFFMIPQHL